MKKTAVEWFVEQLSSYTTTDGNIISHHQNITHLFEQAKQMEKQQIIDSFNQGNIYEGNFFDRVNITAEKYYNKTYKSE